MMEFSSQEFINVGCDCFKRLFHININFDDTIFLSRIITQLAFRKNYNDSI